MNKKIICYKFHKFEYCQAELGGGESTDFSATKRVEDSSVEDQDISLREASGASKTLSDDLVEVHEKGNYVLHNLIRLSIVRLNLEEVNQQISQPPREWRIVQ
jgi:hypothetical protein